MKPVVIETNLPRVDALAVLYFKREDVSGDPWLSKISFFFEVGHAFSETKLTNLSAFSLVSTFLPAQKSTNELTKLGLVN